MKYDIFNIFISYIYIFFEEYGNIENKFFSKFLFLVEICLVLIKLKQKIVKSYAYFKLIENYFNLS